MTITVTPDVLAEPPVNDLVLTAPGSGIMQSLLVWCNEPGGVRRELREQPVAGFNSRPASDPECPYGVEVTYGWTTVYSGSLTTVFTETWASLAAWTLDFGTAFSVSAGTVRNGAAASAMHHVLGAAKYQVTIDSWTVSSGTGYLRLTDVLSNGLLVLTLTAAGLLSIQIIGSAFVPTTIDPSSPFTIDIGSNSVTVTGTGGTKTVLGNISPAWIQLSSNDVPALGYVMDNITVKTYDSPTVLSETSSPVTLDVHDTWLVHPAAPGKSFKLQNVDPLEAGIRTFGDVSRPSKANLVDVMGSDLPVPITFGPRGGAQLSISIATVTSAERLALDVVLADEVPLLVNVPPSWGADIEHGFYSFLTSLERRFVAWLSRQQSARMFEIPVVRVGSPIVDVENSGWSVAAVLAEFASINGTLPSVMDTFATTADLLVNNRS